MSSNTPAGGPAACGNDGRLLSKWWLLLILLISGAAFAEGSRSLHPAAYPAAGARAVMDLTGSTTYGGVAPSRQFLYVYAQAGEYILLGSRNRGNTAVANGTAEGPIFLYGPRQVGAALPTGFGPKGAEAAPGTGAGQMGTPVFTCDGTGTGGNGPGRGFIGTRLAELAGPSSADGTVSTADSWLPCYYQAPTSGVYGVYFSAARTGNPANNAARVSVATPAVISSPNPGVTAWDITVRAAANTRTDLDGRTFTYNWTMYQVSNGASFSLWNTIYIVTGDGYRYSQILRGLDPNRAAFYANSKGLIDAGNPLYHDFRGGSAAATGGPSGVGNANITYQNPEYPIFFSDVGPAGTNGAEVNRVLSELAIPVAPLAPQLLASPAPTFVGNVGGNQSNINVGGTFTFSTQNTLTYEIIISRDGVDFNPSNTLNRVLTGTALSGSHSIFWDGKDSSGNAFPVGTYKYRIVGRNGEVHFPMADVEGNVNGGPTLTKLNGNFAGGLTTLVYYDDRGYRAANGYRVGNLNAHLCDTVNQGTGAVTIASVISQPSPREGLSGVDSGDANFAGSGKYYRWWTGSNDDNSDCNNIATEFFGTAKTLDVWALEKSQVFEPEIVIIPPTTGVDVGTAVSVTPLVLPGDTAYGTFTFYNAGTTSATGVTYSATIGNPGNPVTCPAAVNITVPNPPAGITATYNPGTCTVTFGGAMPTTLTAGQTLGFSFNYVVAPTNPGPIPVDTTINAGNETCVSAGCAPNAAHAETRIAKPIINVVKSSVPAPGSVVSVGDAITYTLSVDVSNAPLTSNLVLTDVLGTGLTFGSVTSNPGSHFTINTGGAPTLTFTLPSGKAIGTYTVTYTATVNSFAVGSVANNVTPSGGGGDNPPTCSPCSVSHNLPAPVISVAKTSNPASGTAVNPGQTITYTVTATVSNAALISPLVLTDTLSANQTFGSVTAAGAYSCTGSVQCTLPTGTAPGTYAVSYTATVNANATGSVGNSVVPTGGTPPSNPPTCTTCTTTHPLNPSASIVKTSNPASGTNVNPGQTITYTLTTTVTNAPLTSALVLTDTLSAGQTFGTVTSAGAYTPNTGGAPTLIFTLPSGTVPGTYAVSYTATVNANATGSVGNSVVPTGGTPPSNPPTCATCTTTHPLNPTASIVKTSNPASGTNVNPGQTITYTLTTTVTNAPLTSNLVLTDTLSAGQTFGTVTSAGAYTPNTGGAPTLIFTLPSGTAPGTYAVSYTATVNANATGSVGNSVVPTGGTPPSNPPTCTTCTTTHPLNPSASIVKTSNPASGTNVNPGQTITYTLTTTVTNAPLTSNLVLTDTLSAGQTFGTVTSAGAYTPNTGGAPTLIFTLPSGTAPGTYAVSYTATVNANATGSVGNSVVPTGGTPPSNPPTCTTCTTTHPLNPTASIVKTSNPASGTNVNPGQTITYTLTTTVTNAPLTSNLVLTDTLSAGQTFGTVTSAGAYTPNTGGAPTLIFTLPSGTVPGTYAVSYTATVNANATGSVGNAVVPTGGTPPSNPPTCAPGACTTTHPLNPTVSVVKTSNPASGTAVVAGQTITYTVTATVSNAALISPLVLTDTLSANQTFGSVTAAGAYSCTGSVQCTLPTGTVPGTYAVSYTATVNANATGSVGNSVVPTGGTPPSNPPTCAPGACTTTHPLDPTVSVTKASNPASGTAVNAGQTITYTLTATVANAPLTSALVLTDTLSAGQTFGTVTSAGAYTPNTGGAPTLIFTLPSGTAPGTYAVSYTATVNANATGSVGNSVVPTGGTPPSNPPTCAPGACTTTHPLNPSASIVKTSNPASGTNVNPGQTITYTLTTTVANAPLTSNLVLTDTLSAGQTFGTVTSAGAYTPNTGGAPTLIFTLPSGTAPGTYAVSYTATVNANATGSVGNSVVPTGGTPPSNPPTCAPGACTTTHPLNPSASIVKTSNPASGTNVNPGQTITYTLTTTVTNAPLTSNLVLTDTLSAGQTFGTVTSAGAYTPNTGGAPTLIFTLPSGTVPGTYAVSYTATVNANATGSVGNAVVPTGGTPPSNPPTCAPGACTTTHPLAANVTIAKTLTGESGSQAGVAEPGENLTYTITLTNTGGVDATGYNLSDAVPANTTFVSASNGGALAGSVVNWTNLTVPRQVGATPGTLVVTVTVQVAASIPAGVTSIANVAYQTGTTPPACPPAGPQCVVTPTAGSVTIAKTLTGENGSQAGVAEPGENLTYTITLTNTGGADVTGYNLSDVVPANTTFVSASNGGALAGSVVNWTNLTVLRQVGATPGTLAVTVTVQVVASIPAGVTSIANVAYQTGTTPPACPPAGPQCVVTPTAGSVTIAKTLTGESGSQAGVAEPGENLTYTITLTNTGGADVAGYNLSDNLPTNTTFVSASNGGALAGSVVNWTNLTVPRQVGATPGTLAVTVTVQVAASIPAGVTSIANVAYQTGTTPPACPPSGPQCVVTPTAGSVTVVKALAGENGTLSGIAEPGEQLTYTITLTNTGGAAANNVGITDHLDALTSFVSASNGGALSGGDVVWTGLTVPVGNPLVLTIVVQVAATIPPGTTQVANLAYVTGTTPPACPPSGPQCVVTPTVAQVTVTKALSGESIDTDGVAEPGELLTYTITVRNDGGTPTLGTLVNETVPQHTIFVSGTPSWTCPAGAPAGTACDALVNVPAHDGTSPGLVTLTFTVQVDDPLPAGVTSIANAVAVDDGDPPDCGALPNDPACVVLPTGNLRLTKTVASVTATGPATYRVNYLIEVVNLGGSSQNYTLTDTLGFPAAGVVFTGNAQVTTTGGTINPGLAGGAFAPANGTVVQLSAANLAITSGATHTYTVSVPIGVQPGAVQDGTCTGAPGHGLYNAAAVTGTFDLDSADCAPVSTDVPLIRLVKTVTLATDVNGNRYGDVGDVLGYTFTISNTGTVPLTSVQLFDPRVQSLQCDPVTLNGVSFRVIPGDELFRNVFDGPSGGGILDPGDSVECRGSYALTADDVARGRVINSATTTGTAPGGQTVSSVGTAIFTAFR